MAKKKTKRKANESSNGHVNAGEIEMTIIGGDLDGQTIKFDASIVKLVADACLIQHPLEVDNNRYKPTPEFAIALKDGLVRQGYEGVTPTLALNAWEKSAAFFAELQKKTS